VAEQPVGERRRKGKSGQAPPFLGKIPEEDKAVKKAKKDGKRG